MCLVVRGTVVKCWSQRAANPRARVQKQRGTKAISKIEVKNVTFKNN